MNITIIGNGNMAKGIAWRALTGGHGVNIHAKDINEARALADELKKAFPKAATVEVKSIKSACDEVVVLAVPYLEVADITEKYGEKLDGKVIVDITNPVDFNTFQLIPAAGRSGAEAIARLLPSSKVVKAFNTTFAGTLIAGEVDGEPLDVFIAGDDREAKATVLKLVGDGGMRPIDVGPLSNSRHLEGLGLIHMAAQDQLGTSWMSAIKIMG